MAVILQLIFPRVKNHAVHAVKVVINLFMRAVSQSRAPCVVDKERVLFTDDFEEGLQTSKWPKSYNGHTVKDPLNPSNNVLGFTACK